MVLDPSFDAYGYLGLNETASIPEIKKALRERTRISHPDTSPVPELAAREMVRLNDVRETLLVPLNKERYDCGRAAQRRLADEERARKLAAEMVKRADESRARERATQLAQRYRAERPANARVAGERVASRAQDAVIRGKSLAKRVNAAQPPPTWTSTLGGKVGELWQSDRKVEAVALGFGAALLDDWIARSRTSRPKR